jgi:hypothetical protein
VTNIDNNIMPVEGGILIQKKLLAAWKMVTRPRWVPKLLLQACTHVTAATSTTRAAVDGYEDIVLDDLNRHYYNTSLY